MEFCTFILRFLGFLFFLAVLAELYVICIAFTGLLSATLQRILRKLNSVSIGGAALAGASTLIGLVWGMCTLH